MEKHGILSLINLSEKESETYLEYLRLSSKSPIYDFVKYLIGEDYIKFLDLLAGSTVKIPSRKALFRDIESIKIYLYVEKHGFTEESMMCASKIFGKKMYFIRSSVKRVSKILEGRGDEEFFTDEDFED